MLRRVRYLLLLGLLGLAASSGGPALSQDKPAPTTDRPKLEALPMDLRQLVEKKDVKELLDELKFAARLSREGQKLTRFQVLLQVEVVKVKGYRDRFATPEADKALKALARDEVRVELKKVATMAPGSERENAYREFSTRNGLAPEAIGQAYQLQKANQRLDRLQVDLAYVDEQLRELDRRATVNDLPFVSVGGLASNQTLQEALTDLEKMRQKTGTTTPTRPTVEKDNLDFLRDLVEPKK